MGKNRSSLIGVPKIGEGGVDGHVLRGAFPPGSCASAIICGKGDSELMHARVQRCALHAQARGRSPRPADNAVRMLQGPRNEFTLGIQ